MELDDFFGNKQRNRSFSYDQNYQNKPFKGQVFRGFNQENKSNFKWIYFLGTLKINRKLKGLIILVVMVVLVIIIALAAVLIPLIGKLLNYISQHGIQGILEYITLFLDRLWKGSGN